MSDELKPSRRCAACGEHLDLSVEVPCRLASGEYWLCAECDSEPAGGSFLAQVLARDLVEERGKVEGLTRLVAEQRALVEQAHAAVERLDREKTEAVVDSEKWSRWAEVLQEQKLEAWRLEQRSILLRGLRAASRLLRALAGKP